ncbi:tetratricopeptide repeat protein [Shimia thalassica]|uniref:tetratricopeptide repeat protein n=1 Tax=Shimia thalassica TaxID=1715693 RepID=UPI0026E27A6C|nr:tetratricopeptide repeat protein [Shimia thalassica]MDO6478544.1 tetratricopeptide repeat protein [Shimia thalassica]
MAASFLRIATASLLISTVSLPVSAQGFAGAYLAGRQAAFDSDYQAASQYYTQALARDPSNPRLLENAVLAFLSLGQVDRAMPVARKMRADGLQSQLANMVITADLVKDGKFETLLEEIDGTLEINELVDSLVSAWAQIGKGSMSEALKAFDEAAKQQGAAGFSAYHKALALASVGDFSGAEAVYSAETDAPVQMTRRSVIALVQILSQLERNEEALNVMKEMFGTALDPRLQDMYDTLEAGGELEFSVVSGASDGIAEVFYTLADVLAPDAAPDYTLMYARVAEYLRPDHVEALLLSAGLLDQMGRYELATEAYKRVPADHPSFHAAEMGRADALRMAGKNDAAIEVLEQLTRTHGELSSVHSALGDVLRQQKDFEGAVAAYDKAIELDNTLDRALWFVYYARGICHERLDKWDMAEADFRKALELNPEQPQVLNYLGYSMVEKQIKLDEALNMIERAVAARPGSGYIVDSLGWVLFRLGRYDEAVGHMERATELMPIDPVVNDHLGDVYWAVGRNLEAEFQWKRALSFVSDDTAEEANPDRIRRKLEVGLDQVLEEEGADPLKVANEG